MMNRIFFSAIVAMITGTLVSNPCNAQLLDGSIVGDNYGAPLAVQTVNTGFGDNFNELNAAYGRIENGQLRLVFTGQIESFNKLNIFIDSVAGGENTLTNTVANGGNNTSNDGWAEDYGNGGFTFDSDFFADYVVIARQGNAGMDQFDLDLHGVGNDTVVETAGNVFGGNATGVAVTGLGIGIGYDNSNTGGVVAGSDAANQADAAAVQTGLELFLPLSLIGNPALGDEILISAHINNSNHDFLSNQFLGEDGGLPGGTNNLGSPGNIDLGDFAGNQYFRITVVPEPSSALAIGSVAILGLVRRRRS